MQLFHKYIAILLLALMFNGCATTTSDPNIRNDEILVTDPEILDIANELRPYVDPFTLRYRDIEGTAFCHPENDTVVLTKKLINDFKSGKYNRYQLMNIMAHECGHLSITGKAMLKEEYNMGCEIMADYFSILVMEEMRNDGHPIDLYNVISRFLIRDREKGILDQSDADRYHMLKEKLDYWKKHEGKIES